VVWRVLFLAPHDIGKQYKAVEIALTSPLGMC
jgi:hypothetical protein